MMVKLFSVNFIVVFKLYGFYLFFFPTVLTLFKTIILLLTGCIVGLIYTVEVILRQH